MRTWRRCLSCNGSCSSSWSTRPCMARSLMVASTKRWATSSDASISTRVAVRVLKIEIATATNRARRLINPTATKSWVRTDRSYQSFCNIVVHSPEDDWKADPAHVVGVGTHPCCPVTYDCMTGGDKLQGQGWQNHYQMFPAKIGRRKSGEYTKF